MGDESRMGALRKRIGVIFWTKVCLESSGEPSGDGGKETRITVRPLMRSPMWEVCGHTDW